MGLLVATERRGRYFPGRTFWLYVLFYAVSRFVIEFYRGDERGMIWSISTSQFISLVLFPVSVAMLLWLRRRTDTPAAPTPSKAASSARRTAHP
jgi:phosphatidylglycerol:prolipoprotein diacylglycerol transferase